MPRRDARSSSAFLLVARTAFVVAAVVPRLLRLPQLAAAFGSARPASARRRPPPIASRGNGVVGDAVRTRDAPPPFRAAVLLVRAAAAAATADAGATAKGSASDRRGDGGDDDDQLQIISSNDSGSDDDGDESQQLDEASALRLLKRYETNRDVERAVVRLGRSGRTDDALRLHDAVWTLEGMRSKYGANRHKLKGRRKSTKNDPGKGEESTEESRPSLAEERRRFASKSKLRPTTRLMNSAIDACARSHPRARQSRAFAVFNDAISPRNPDGSKKPGGAISPNVFTFGSLLACCARNGDVAKSLELLEILEEGKQYPDAKPNGVVYSTAISACERAEVPDSTVALRLLNRGIERLASATEGGGGMGVVGYNAAISVLARAADWRSAVRLLGEMILRSSSSRPTSNVTRSSPAFASMESLRSHLGAADGRPPPPLLAALERDPDAVVPPPDEVTFGTVLAACERSGRWEELLRVAEAAGGYGVALDGVGLTSALHACQRLGLADEALGYLDRMKRLGDGEDDGGDEGGDDEGETKRGAEKRRNRRRRRTPLRGPDGVAYRLAISACARSPHGHRWRDGIRLLDEMRDVARRRDDPSRAPDVVAYTAAIAGCSQAGEYAEAMRLVSVMRGEGVRPNVVTYSAVIDACASASAKAASRRREEDAADRFLGGTSDDGGGAGGGERDDDVDVDVETPMRGALRLLAAMRAPDSPVRPNVVTYNAAIRACAEGLRLSGAFEVLDLLKGDGLAPTVVTYGTLMTACERAGDVHAASRAFKMLKEEGLEANEIVYGAAISCCRRAGEPERALRLLRKMIAEDLRPNAATFNTVLAALAEGGGGGGGGRGSSTSRGGGGGGGGGASSRSERGRLWERALAVYRFMRSSRSSPDVVPNRQTYAILVRCLASNLEPGRAEAVLVEMREAGFVPDVDLYTATVRSYERCGNPLRALGLMESMREVGYDFYGVRVLDEAFKSGVKMLNRVGKNLYSEPGSEGGEGTSGGYGGVLYEEGGATASGFGEYFDDDDDYEYRLMDSLK
ncbi:hypothetical protein ACHAWF_012701 [Thalassiosira exigua]